VIPLDMVLALGLPCSFKCDVDGLQNDFFS
jgi:hypothetical protein